MKLWHKNIIAIIIGGIIGVIFKEKVADLKIFGELFINIIKMLAVPLVFFSIIRSITNLSGKANIRSLLTKSMSSFVIFGVLAALIGIVVAFLVLEKSDISTAVVMAEKLPKGFSLKQIFAHIFPTNLLTPFIEDKVLHVVILAMFISYALIAASKPPTAILNLVSDVTEMLLKMLDVVMKMSPYAIFAYTSWLASTLTVDQYVKYSKLFLILAIGFSLILLIIALAIKFITGLNPIIFFKKSFEYQIMAFSTGSSKAVLPFTISESISKLGISHSTANLLIPLGASVNLIGLSLYVSALSVFLAYYYNIELNFANYFAIFIISVITPVGGAGIVGGALLIMPILLTALQIPYEAMVFITAIDPILNGLRTAMTITGDVAIAVLVDKEIDKEVYNSVNKVI